MREAQARCLLYRLRKPETVSPDTSSVSLQVKDEDRAFMNTTAATGARLSQQQARLWSFQQHSSAYQAICALRLQGSLHTEMLQQAIQQVVDRYEILRTNFAHVPGMDLPLQVVSGAGTWYWQVNDWQGEDLNEQMALFAQELNERWRLEHSSLLSVQILHKD